MKQTTFVAYGVLLKRSGDGSTFLAYGPQSTCGVFHKRSDAQGFRRELANHKLKGRVVAVKVTHQAE